MDYEEMSKAYKNAKYQKGSGYEKNTWGAPNPKDAYINFPSPDKYISDKGNSISKTPYVAPAPVEVDYSIVSMPNGTYIVARSHRLGSLDYDFVCECETRHDAREIVKALNK
jgi:hypothetical protein